MLRQRWYWRVVSYFWRIYLLVLLASMTGLWTSKFLPAWANSLLVSALFPLYIPFQTFIVVGILWEFWAAPYLESGDIKAQFRKSPEERRILLLMYVWVPVLTLLVLTAAAILWVPVEEWVRRSLWDWSNAWMNMARILVLATVCTGVFAWLLMRLISRRFERTHSHTHYCQNCGYNLLGNTTGRCPECGQSIDEATSE